MLKASLAIIVLLVVLAGARQLTRPGYSVDEEFTVFAVRGIATEGLPILPSGLLYDRGLAYSYLGALLNRVTGSALPAYRAISLASAAIALVLIFVLVRRAADPRSALLAAILAASSISFWAAATTGRFYAPFLAAYLGLLVVLAGSRRVAWLFALAAVARLTHELAFTAAMIPALFAVLSPKTERTAWLKATAAVVAGLLAAQAAIFVFHYLAPSSGETMIRRFFLWQVFNLFEVPPDRQFGIVFLSMLLAWLLVPARAGLTLVIALCGVAMVLGAAFAHGLQVMPLSWVLVASVLLDGSRYPLDMFWHIARTTPVALGLALALLVARLRGAGGEWRAPARAAHLAWIGWVAWFGVIESGITISYLLLPVTLMLAAIAIDLVAISDHRSLRRSYALAAAALVIVAIGADQWRGQGSLGDRLSAARPTIEVPGIEVIRDGLQASDRVACTDELACLMLVGRVDAWLALHDYVRDRFAVRRADGEIVGVYAGAPAAFRPADLFGDLKDGRPPERVLIVDVFKEYPMGNSRVWLPKAIDTDGLEARTLLETPHARVVEVSPPLRNARRQP
ncbi:MAG: glycosyltransferase family 39 protein [Vicinamibacterales bacterium]